MPFSQLSQPTIDHAWHLARGQCECQRGGHGHEHRCGNRLALHVHGQMGAGGWFAVPWTALGDGGADTAENVEVLCEACYQAVMQERRSARRLPGPV